MPHQRDESAGSSGEREPATRGTGEAAPQGAFAGLVPAAHRMVQRKLQRRAVQRREGAVIQRKIGKDKHNAVVKKGPLRYVARSDKKGGYDLEPLLPGGTPQQGVKDDDDDYDVEQDDETFAQVKDNKNDDERHRQHHEMAEWSFRAAQVTLEAGGHDDALKQLQRASEHLGALQGKSKVKQETLDLKALGSIAHSKFVGKLLLSHVLAPKPLLHHHVKTYIDTNRGLLESKSGLDNGTTSEDAATVIVDAFVLLRRDPKYLDSFLRAATGAVAGKESEVGVKKREAYEKAVPPLMEDKDFRGAYEEMAREKFGQEARKNQTAKVPNEKFTNYEGLIDEVHKETGEEKEALRTKYHVLSQLNEHLERSALKELLKRSLDNILRQELHKKTSRMQHLFQGQEKFAEEVRTLIKAEDLHIAFEEMLKGEPHSIQNINDYVGDKLNDPLMKWIISKKIPVEVHGTSLLGSFAKLQGEGFTDIIELPSSHTGTKKFVASNPKSKQAKVVFQTLPGKSYAIQATGPFLFYELYELGGEIKQEGSQKDKSSDTLFVHEGYKARNLIAVHGDRAQYLLTKGKEFLVAELPFVKTPPPIDKDGAIKLEGVDRSAVKLLQVDVKRLPPEQLQVFTETLDYEQVYLDALKSLGIQQAQVATIGRKGQLKTELKNSHQIEPVLEETLPYFNVSVFRLKHETMGQVVTMLSFQISPDFFGDRAGYLAKALASLGVQHITFVGTAGGLGKGVAKGDLLIPETLQNYAELKQSDKTMKNQAYDLLKDDKDVKGKDGIKTGGLHLGVHSPITESQDTIEKMKQLQVASVDCEAGFIADALAGSGVSVYSIYYISDVPGSQESIGMGGHASGGGDSEEGGASNLSELLVLKLIQQVTKAKLEQAEKASATGFKHVLGKDGKLNKKISIDGKSTSLTVRAVIPELVQHDVVGVLKVFRQRLSTFLDSKDGKLALLDTGEIDKMVTEVYKKYSILLEISYT